MVKMICRKSMWGKLFVDLTTLSKSAKMTDNVDRSDSPSVVHGSRGKEQ